MILSFYMYVLFRCTTFLKLYDIKNVVLTFTYVYKKLYGIFKRYILEVLIIIYIYIYGLFIFNYELLNQFLKNIKK